MAGTELKQSKDAPLSFFSFQDIIASVTALMVLITLVIALDPLGDEVALRKGSAPSPMSQQGRADQARVRLEQAQAAIAQARQALQERQSQPNVTADLIARMERLVAPERDGVAALEQVAAQGDAELRAVEDRLLVVQTETKDTERELIRRREAEADRVMRSRVRVFQGPPETLKPLLVELRPDSVVIGTLDDSLVPVELKRCEGTGKQAIDCVADLLATYPKSEWYGLFVVWADGLDDFRDMRAAFIGRGYQVGWQIWDGTNGGFFERPQDDGPAEGDAALPPQGAPAAGDAGARGAATGVPLARHVESVQSMPSPSPSGDPHPWPLVIPASVATAARMHRRGRKGGSIGTDPFGLFLDALCNTLGVVMLLLMMLLIFSKDERAARDPKAVEAEAVESERMAIDAESELRGLLEALSKLPPAGDPALVERWNQLLADGERLRTRNAALQQSISALREELEARRKELEESEARKRVVDAQFAALAAKSPKTPDFIRLSRFRPDPREPVSLGVAFGQASTLRVDPIAGAGAPTRGMPLGTDDEADAAIAQLLANRVPADVRLEIAVWADSFAEYKRLERRLVERGYAINPIPVKIGGRVGFVAGQGGVQ
jgi:hypothetical protein